MFGTYCRLNVHVGASNREVIRAARRKLRKQARHRHQFRGARHKFFRAMLTEHARAKTLYSYVLSGGAK